MIVNILKIYFQKRKAKLINYKDEITKSFRMKNLDS